MGCDYYIIKKLHIYYNDNDYIDIEVKRERGYFSDDDGTVTFNSDDETSEEQYNEYIEYILTPKMKPITLYDGLMWNKPESESKYKTLLDTIIQKNKIKWNQIIRIVKIEEREQR